MRTIASLIDHELTWIQRRGMKSEFELRFGDDLVATLRFPKMLGSAAIAESGDGSWTFERLGLLKAKTIIRVTGSNEELATYTPKMWSGGGILQLSGGRTVSLTRAIWDRVVKLRCETGEEIVELRGRGFFRYSMNILMFRKGAQFPEFPWMVMFIAYQAIMMRREAAAHSAAH